MMLTMMTSQTMFSNISCKVDATETFTFTLQHVHANVRWLKNVWNWSHSGW